MTATRTKKVKKYRGSKTHGCGSMKKRRGAGNRGGRGAAGSGKRGDAKKPTIWGSRYFGKFGFTSKKKNIVKSINLKEIEIKLNLWAQKGLIKEEKGIYIIDLAVLGYDKLLGTGKINTKIKIKVDKISPKAEEKIKKAGGEILS